MKNLLLGHTRFLNLFKFSSFSSTSRFNNFTTTSLKLKVTSLKLSQSKRGFIFQQPLNLASNYLRNFRYSGIGCILGASVATASTIAYATNAEDALVDDHHRSDSLNLDYPLTTLLVKIWLERYVEYLWKLVRRFWLPLLFVATVLTSLDYPFTILFIKLTLFLLSTNPNPFSVYVFVDQLCKQSISKDTKFFDRKSFYASKVEVQDYKLLCLADVEVRDHKFTLVGILGTWWTLPHSH